ncbi:N-acetyltransferase [Nonlabens sp. Ci31]|jgi:predicted GNAT family acetyltransferase|uniref:GNAT family N-acetyltransferase n=1 Tax=Nonlabens sp. Ci31 TaxID=2608253 RepID=UPI0014629E81|nr:GNAT family N-acetyltransferase [Nonlabens sp. Ci31]QJP33394.1 N-acetyltransferase [Nonlabens sp. Ci31]
MASIQHKENDSRGLFYLKEGNKTIAELTYTLKDNVMTIDHTEVHSSQEGRGLGTQLVTESYHFAKEKGRKIHPLCPFAEVLFDKNDSWHKVRV